MADSQKKYRAILLFGMPGSGKGTQGNTLGQLPRFAHISMGEVFRKLPLNSKVGREIVKTISDGNMVSDNLTIEIYNRHIQILESQELITREHHVLILDGIPRNSNQARMLSDTVDVQQIFHLKSSYEVARKRLRIRAVRENRLDDLKEETVNHRIKVYEGETLSTLQVYDPAIIHEVDASLSPLLILKQIVNRLSDVDGLKFISDDWDPVSSAG